MTTPPLLEQALALPLEERIGLAAALWESINAGFPVGEDREAIDQATRRDADLTSGAVPGRTHEEVMRTARQAIGCD